VPGLSYHDPFLAMATGLFTILAGLVALAGAYLYFFGLSPETKRAMEKQALKTMGENKLSYMAKGKLPMSRSPRASSQHIDLLQTRSTSSLLPTTTM